GTGTVAPATGNGVTINGVLAPGLSATTGTLTVGAAGRNNFLTFGDGGELDVRLASASLLYQVHVLGTGTITLGAGSWRADLSVTLMDGYTPQSTDMIPVLLNDTGKALSGFFTDASTGTVLSGSNNKIIVSNNTGTYAAFVSYTGQHNAGGSVTS